MEIPQRLPDENARTYAHRVILDNIITLALPPGSAVSENELSASLHLSRTPVREALIEMSRMGLVEILPQRGSYVTKIDYALIEDAKFIRQSLEVSVIKELCQKEISPEIIARIRQNMEEQRLLMERDENRRLMLSLDNDFHRLLFEAAGRLRAHSFLSAQAVHFDRLRTLSYKTLKTERLTRTYKDHENLLYALSKKDSELAEFVMTSHLARHEAERAELVGICPEYFSDSY